MLASNLVKNKSKWYNDGKPWLTLQKIFFFLRLIEGKEKLYGTGKNALFAIWNGAEIWPRKKGRKFAVRSRVRLPGAGVNSRTVHRDA